MIHDLVPGPRLFVNNPEIIYGLFASLLIANIVLLVFGLFGSKLWIKVTSIPKNILFPMIFAISVVGSFAVRYSFFDVISCFAFGVFGWILKRNNYPVAPIILGLVLGNIAETNFRRAVMMGGYNIFFTRPGSLILLLIAAVSFIIPFMRNKKEKNNSSKQKS